VSEYSPFELSPLPRVALDAHGNAHYVWLAMADSHKVVRARSRGSDGSLGDIQQLSAPGTGSTGNASDPSIANGANGQPVAAWTRMSESGSTLVHGAVLVPQPATESGGTSGGAGGGSGTSGDAGGTGAASEPDRLAPKLSGLVLKPAKLVVRRRGRVAYALTEPSTVTLRVVRRGARRRVVGALRATGSAGRNSLVFRGRLRGRYLRPGRYQLVAVATDRAGNRSAASRARFRVVLR
jgi:hypothetical protein